MEKVISTEYEVKIKVKQPKILGIFSRKKKQLLLEYPEASTMESLEFLKILEGTGEQLLRFAIDFLKTWTKPRRKSVFYTKIAILNLQELTEILKKTRFKSLFEEVKSRENNTKKDILEDGKTENKKDLDDMEKQIGRLTAFLSEKMALDPKTILEKYTFTQLNFWTDHYIYMENEKTEDGRKANETEENRKYIEKNKSEIDKQLDRINLYYKQKTPGKKD